MALMNIRWCTIVCYLTLCTICKLSKLLSTLNDHPHKLANTIFVFVGSRYQTAVMETTYIAAKPHFSIASSHECSLSLEHQQFR